MSEHLRFIFADHFWAALDALILFAVGMFAAVPVVRYRVKAVKWLPLKLFRLVVRLIGDGGIPRTAAVIWAFNSVSIFIYMASGFHPLLPKLFAIWTGLNVAVLMFGIDREEDPVLSRLVRPPENRWQASPGVLLLCSGLVLAVELPCFWFAIGMGIRMGQLLQTNASYWGQLLRRGTAYGTVIVPLLLLSAIAEAIAIRAAPKQSKEHQDDGA